MRYIILAGVVVLHAVGAVIVTFMGILHSAVDLLAKIGLAMLEDDK